MSKAECVYFVTSNDKKFTSLQEMLSSLDINLRQLRYDFDEGRELDIYSIAVSKLTQAKEVFPGKRLIVDDRGFFIPALKGFPGPFVKLVLDSFGSAGIGRLMTGELDRRAIFSFAIAYFDGERDHVFTVDEEGFIIEEPRGQNLHGWTDLLRIYGHPRFPDRSLAELSDGEWKEYLLAIENIDVFAKLRDYLIAQK